MFGRSMFGLFLNTVCYKNNIFFAVTQNIHLLLNFIRLQIIEKIEFFERPKIFYQILLGSWQLPPKKILSYFFLQIFCMKFFQEIFYEIFLGTQNIQLLLNFIRLQIIEKKSSFLKAQKFPRNFKRVGQLPPKQKLLVLFFLQRLKVDFLGNFFMTIFQDFFQEIFY